jgi:transcriptional regulator with XRE-family HTH domain
VHARVGARLKQLRLERRLTQEQLAEGAGLSYKFVGEVERGVANPTLATLDTLTSALGVEVGELFHTEYTPRPPSAHDVFLARAALQSLDAFIQRARPNPEVKYKARRRKSRQ